jgi:hypothetical protein
MTLSIDQPSHLNMGDDHIQDERSAQQIRAAVCTSGPNRRQAIHTSCSCKRIDGKWPLKTRQAKPRSLGDADAKEILSWAKATISRNSRLPFSR